MVEAIIRGVRSFSDLFITAMAAVKKPVAG